MADKRKVLTAILVVIIIILLVIVIYTLVIRPSLSGYVIDKQSEGVQIAIASIVAQVEQNGFAQIPVGNQTLYLRPFNPQQIQQ